MKTLSNVSSQGYTWSFFAPKALLSTLMLLFVFACSQAQVLPQLPQHYQKLELRAPTQTKTILKNYRQQIVNKKLTFQVGFTEVMNTPLSQLAGEAEIPASTAYQLKRRLSQQPFLPNLGITSGICAAGSRTYDARNKGHITPVRRQQCGNCWAYAAMAMFEANYLKVNGGNPNNVDASEQYVVSCSGGGSCSGGLSWRVFDWMVSSNKNISGE